LYNYTGVQKMSGRTDVYGRTGRAYGLYTFI